MTHPIHSFALAESPQVWNYMLLQTHKNIRAQHPEASLRDAFLMVRTYRDIYFGMSGHFNHWIETQWENFNSPAAHQMRDYQQLLTDIGIYNRKYDTNYHLAPTP